MRTLKFIVDELQIKLDPNCDFSGLVPGTDGYLEAKFSFSPEWDDCVKVAAFYSPMLGKEFPPRVLANDACLIPTEALKRRTFKVQVMGKNKNYKLTTNKVAVTQDGGN